jgi:hypothetical protein
MITVVLGAILFLVIIAAIGIAWGANNRRRAGQAGTDAVANQLPHRPKVGRANGHN